MIMWCLYTVRKNCSRTLKGVAAELLLFKVGTYTLFTTKQLEANIALMIHIKTCLSVIVIGILRINVIAFIS